MQITDSLKQELKSWIVHQDEHLVVINKPADLAVQGGTGVKESIDGMLSGFKESADSETPMLVHRLVRLIPSSRALGAGFNSVIRRTNLPVDY